MQTVIVGETCDMGRDVVAIISQYSSFFRREEIQLLLLEFHSFKHLCGDNHAKFYLVKFYVTSDFIN